MPLGVASVGHRKRLLAGIANLGLAYGRDLAVHLGIANGEVVTGGLAGTGRREYSVVGDSVNLAARQVAMAKPGQTLVSDPVRRRLADCARFDSLDETQV